MTEYKIIFKSSPDGGMDINAEVIGEDNTIVTQIGAHFMKGIIEAVDHLLDDTPEVL